MINANHPLAAIMIAAMLFMLYWMGRIDGFNRRRTNNKLDIKVRENILRFQDFVFGKVAKFFKFLKDIFRK
ncbi:hypothetical protein D0429_10090 [Staphylococcus auricularis]|nr:hypothetical protein [Staphylococcus auricularis]